LKVRFHGQGCASPEKELQNIAYAKSLGLPDIWEAKASRLAFIGGGHSIGGHVDALRNFDGERWIAAGAFPWCLENGIEGAFMACGAEPSISRLAQGAKRALLASACDPSLFDALKDADLRLFHLVHEPLEKMNHGPSTATCAPYQAVRVGFKELIFYGCDSSYPFNGTSHLYEDEKHPYEMVVRCGGEDFKTTPLLLMQAEYLSTVIRAVPKVFKEESGGLLRALVKDPEYDITHGTPQLHQLLKVA
jgi:hypothetical protein